MKKRHIFLPFFSKLTVWTIFFLLVSGFGFSQNGPDTRDFLNFTHFYDIPTQKEIAAQHVKSLTVTSLSADDNLYVKKGKCIFFYDSLGKPTEYLLSLDFKTVRFIGLFKYNQNQNLISFSYQNHYKTKGKKYYTEDLYLYQYDERNRIAEVKKISKHPFFSADTTLEIYTYKDSILTSITQENDWLYSAIPDTIYNQRTGYSYHWVFYDKWNKVLYDSLSRPIAHYRYLRIKKTTELDTANYSLTKFQYTLQNRLTEKVFSTTTSTKKIHYVWDYYENGLVKNIKGGKCSQEFTYTFW